MAAIHAVEVITTVGGCDELLAALPSYWDRPRAHSLLKHSLLGGYLPVFATKTASSRPDRRVVFVDGYAGAGRYRDGSPGSPLIALEIAQRLSEQKRPTNLDCVFVERKRSVFAAMKCAVGGGGHAIHGDLRRCLPTALEVAADAPLFMFLDPYGFLPSMESLVSDVLRRDRGGRRRPTELLVSLMTYSVEREAGLVLGAREHDAAEGTEEALDEFMGGAWWREVVEDQALTDEERDRQLSQGWAERIEAKASGYQAWNVAIPRRWDEAGYYYLVLVTAHHQGGWYFADQMQRSLQQFYDNTVGVRPQLFDPDYRRREATDVMRANLRTLLATRSEFVLGEVTRELYGDALGWGGIKEISGLVRELDAAGELDVVDGKVTQSELHKARVRVAGTMSLGF